MSRILCKILVAATLGVLTSGLCRADGRADVNDIAESYVKLVLEIGLYDDVYVDAYYGPVEWRPPETAKEDPFPAGRLGDRAGELTARLGKIDARGFSTLEKQRLAYLQKHLTSARAKIDLLAGRKMSFDEESKALYDVVAPARDEAYFDDLLQKLDKLLPGTDDLYWRFTTYRTRFTLPRDKLEQAFKALIDEDRRRTLQYVPLPKEERYDLRFVFAKPWAAAATYKGNGVSLIEISSQVPFGIADAEILAAHEIYPGHHVHLTLLDESLVKGRKWVEYTVLILHSPLAVITEGLAEYGGKDLLMTRNERLDFDRKVLLPLLGMDLPEIETYEQVMELDDAIDDAQAEAARRYLDGRLSRIEAMEWLRRHGLGSGGLGSVLLFIDKNRTYMVTYTVGRQLVREYVEKYGGDDPARRWQAFRTLMSTPQTPSGLMEAAGSRGSGDRR